MEEIATSDIGLSNGFSRIRDTKSTCQYVAALDIGTTSVRCIIYDSNAKVRGSDNNSIELIYPQLGLVEIDPNALWEKVIGAIRGAIIGW